MRIWDIHPGYLNRQSLLGEHRELHGIVSILVNKKKGYSHHPETKRWMGNGWALYQRHQLLRAEMMLRGFNEKTPAVIEGAKDRWPFIYIDPPHIQFNILKAKYETKSFGRIPLPVSTQQLWAHHKYSVLARDPEKYSEVGKRVSRLQKKQGFENISLGLVELLRKRPSVGGLKNTLQHMWGHVSEYSDKDASLVNTMNGNSLLHEIQCLALKYNEPYLMQSTALSELAIWI